LFLGIAILIYWAARRRDCITQQRLSKLMPLHCVTTALPVTPLARVATGAVLWSL